MVDKKHWLSEIQEEEPKNSQLDISWSSSESESDRLFKLDEFNKKTKASRHCWVKPVDNSEDDLFSSPEHSPIINSLRIKDLSPILTENTINDCEQFSPVIGKRHKLKQIRTNYKKVKKQLIEIHDEQNSPDLFYSQSTQVIDGESPESSVIDVINSVQSETVNFVPSQCSSSEVQSETTNNIQSQCCSKVERQDSSTSSHSSILYHQPTTKRKRFKKKGLASLLQKTLNLQKTRVSIWKHELYMKRSPDSVQGVINFKVLNIQREYGNIFAECHEMHHNSTSDCNNTLSNDDHFNLMLILISQNAKINMIEEITYKLHPPYESKIVIYKSQEITCYFNVTRIVQQII